MSNAEQWLVAQEVKSKLINVLPSNITPEKFTDIAIAALARTPDLQKCTQQSLIRCVTELATFGLTPDGRRAHLVPFRNRKQNTYECTLIIDYKGLVELILRSGIVKKIRPELVCEHDEFLYNKGEVVKHIIDPFSDRGAIKGAYAEATFADGLTQVALMSKKEIDGIMYRTQEQGKSGPWKYDYGEMAKKTAFRRLAKWLPLTPEAHEAAEYISPEEKITEGDTTQMDELADRLKPTAAVKESLTVPGDADAVDAEFVPDEKEPLPTIVDEIKSHIDAAGVPVDVVTKIINAAGLPEGQHDRLEDMPEKFLDAMVLKHINVIIKKAKEYES